MKLLSSGSHNIAWFKLAEFVTRGEKERALQVYKLLMHSVDDKAFALQLEAEILLAFDDQAAIYRYDQAADMYKKQKNYKKAIAVYERIAIYQENLHVLQALIDAYADAHDYSGLINSFVRFAHCAVQTDNIMILLNKLYVYAAMTSLSVQAELYGHTFFALLKHDRSNSSLQHYLQQALELYVQGDKPALLDKFMIKLKVLDEVFYHHAVNFLGLTN